VPKKDPLQPKRCAELLAALAAPERLNIVRLLADGPRNVTEIIAALRIKPLNVSHHLSVLRNAGLIKGEKKGRFVWYALRPGVLEEAVNAGVPRDALNLGCCKLELPCDAAG
jgi:DNA-binding transcriptional ArsR family regulator